jgi:hypothetical protein
MAGMPWFLPKTQFSNTKKGAKRPFWYRFAVPRLQTVVRVRVSMPPIVIDLTPNYACYTNFFWRQQGLKISTLQVTPVIFNCFNFTHNSF